MVRINKRWWSTVRYCVLIMVICFAWALAGCAGDIINSKVENKIKESLPKLIGPAKSYDVEVRGPHSKMIKGHIKKLVIHGKDVWMLPDLCVDKLEVRMADVKADRKKSALKSVGETSFDAVISEKSLNEYIDSIRTDNECPWPSESLGFLGQRRHNRFPDAERQQALLSNRSVNCSRIEIT